MAGPNEEEKKPKPLKPGEFCHEALGCSFSLPEPFRMRHVMQFEAGRDEARAAGGQFAPAINWAGALRVIENWECETLPKPHSLSPDDLGDAHGPVLQVIMWVGSQVSVYVMEKLFIPKN